MKNFFLVICFVMCATAMSAQNRDAVLACIEDNTVSQLANGMRIQVVKTSEYQHYTYRLTADVSAVGEGQYTGIKSVVADLTGSDFLPNDLIVKKMVSHNNALDSVFEFLSEVVFGNKQNSFHDYQTSKLRQFENNYEYRVMALAAQASGEQSVNIETLRSMDSKTVESFIKQCFSPEKCILTVVADVEPSVVQEAAQKYFGKLTKTVVKSQPDNRRIPSGDVIYSIDETAVFDVVVAYRSYFPFAKTAKNYALGNVAYHVMFGKRANDADRCSSIRHDTYSYFERIFANGFDVFQGEFFAPRNPNFDFAEAGAKAKDRVIEEFDKKLLRPEYAAEIASHLLLYKFPKNYFTNYRQSVAAVTASDISDFFSGMEKNGRSVMVVQGNKRALHCALFNAARYREVDFVDSSLNPSRIIPKGFGEKTIIDNYLAATGLNNPPKNLMVDFTSTYSFGNHGTYDTRGRILRKMPDMYKMENYVVHAPDTLVIHYTEMFDGASGVDSSALWGNVRGDSIRNMELRQKAAYPIEAHYARLNIQAYNICDYELDSAGYYVLDVNDPLGGHYRDFFSIDNGVKVRTQIFLDNKAREGEILYQYAKNGAYYIPVLITERSPGLIIETKITSYNTETALKITDFQPYVEPVDKKKKR
ncbi:MAG: insulinase family protein [Bacteroidales bacterium]|nr:insulinase family protein [Bacteroidales bacterium]